MIWGLATKKTGGGALALVGAGGIALSVIGYAALIHFVADQRGSVDEPARVLRARHTITALTYAIEFYKTQTGQYPLNLDVLGYSMPPEQSLIIIDPMIAQTATSRLFHYELVDAKHYVLLGAGADGQLFTNDDILPDVAIKPDSEIGLVTNTK